MADPGEVAPHVEAAFFPLCARSQCPPARPALAEKRGSRDQHHQQRESGDDRAMIIAGSDEANRREECKRDTEHARGDHRRDHG